MASTMSVGPSHGSPLHGVDLLFRKNYMGSRSGRWILGGMGHLYRQDPQVRGCVLFLHGPSPCRSSPSIMDSLNMGTNGSAAGSTRGGA